MQRGPGSVVDFAEIAPFAWDRVYVFHPYTPHKHIHRTLGFNWSGVARTTIEYSEGVNLVVFVSGEKVVHWFEHPRWEELAELADSKGYAREHARFRVCRVGVDERLALGPLAR
jgi:hypothetical protein